MSDEGDSGNDSGASGAPGGPEVLRAATEWVRAFAELALAAVFLPEAGRDELRLAASAGGPVGAFGLRSRYPLLPSGPGVVADTTTDTAADAVAGAVADAVRTNRPQWPSSAAEVDGGGGASGGDFGFGVLPLPAPGGGSPSGCLIVADRRAAGFGAARRGFLELLVGAVAERSGTGREHHGSFSVDAGTGRVTADAPARELLGPAADAFDGQVEVLLAPVVPEDLPTLLSAVVPRPGTAGGEVEFRVRRRSGKLRWLHLRSWTPEERGGAGRAVRAVLVDTDRLRAGTDEVLWVQRLSARLAGARTVREVCQVAATALMRLEPDRFALIEPEQGTGQLLITALHPTEPATWPDPWRAAWPAVPAAALPVLERVLRAGHPVIPEAGGRPTGLAGAGRGALVLLPLPAEGQVIGVCLVGWEAERGFGPPEQLLLTAFAYLTGQAMGRVRLLGVQHEFAGIIQRSLLPRELPRLPGAVTAARYLPATVGPDVGGDWYDVVHFTDRRAAFVVGDVQGHSAGAAAIMGRIRTAIRAYAVEGHPPDVVISLANRLLLGMATDLYATCCYVDVDLEEGDAWLVLAGHLPPLVRDPDGTIRELEAEAGPPLGVLAAAEFPMSTVGLVPGAVLALLTDGLVESSVLPLEEGLRRVGEQLTALDPADADRLADGLLGDAVRREDDVALLVLRYDGLKVKPRRASWTLWRLADAVGHARRFTARTLRAWGVAAETDTALLIVSELVTNAVVHTQGQVHLDLTLAGDRLRIAVSDSSPRTPVKPTQVEWEATGGRGLLILEAVAESWGSVPLSGGKQVWAEIAVSPGDPTGGSADPQGGEGQLPPQPG